MLFWFASLLVVSAVAQDAPPPVFDLHGADGAAGSGFVEQLQDDWSIQLGGAKPILLKGQDLVSLRRSKMPLPSYPHAEHVVFANGDRLAGNMMRLSNERLTFMAQFGKGPTQLTLPLTALAILWLAAPDGTLDTESLRRQWLAGRRTRDLIVLRNRDQIEGTLTDLEIDVIRVRGPDRKEIRLERGRVAAIVLSNDLARTLRPRGAYARAMLANGTRLSFASARIESPSQLLTGKTLFGSAVEVALDQLVALDLHQGRAVYLADLKPKLFEHTAYLGVSWPLVRDGSVAGHEMRLAGSTFDKGIGLHSESRVAYDLAGGYQWLEALVGLDDRTGRNGNVAIEVLVDDKPRDIGFKELAGLEPPRPIRVDVKGARTLTLIVRFGLRGDVQDHVDWADARLIKNK